MKETIPQTMTAALLTGHGGFDRLEYRQDVSVPAPKTDEVLIRVLACGINNTDVNTRIGWYSKSEQVLALGAGRVISRDEELGTAIGREKVDVVCDLVAGPKWPQLLEVLKKGGQYAVAGAIAGPMVELDVRTLYLKDLTFLGCTFQDPVVFENLVSYIEKNEIRPVVARVYPLEKIVRAQKDFLSKTHTGKLVMTPPSEV